MMTIHREDGNGDESDLIAAVSIAALPISESMGYASVTGVPADNAGESGG